MYESFVAPSNHEIEPKVFRLAVKCHVKRQTPSKSDKKVHPDSEERKSIRIVMNQTTFIVERVEIVSSNETRSSFMVPFTFHTEYSPTVTTQLDTGATCSAMSYTDLLNILQLGEVQLDPPRGKIRLYDGSVVNLFGSFQSAETVALNAR